MKNSKKIRGLPGMARQRWRGDNFVINGPSEGGIDHTPRRGNLCSGEGTRRNDDQGNMIDTVSGVESRGNVTAWVGDSRVQSGPWMPRVQGPLARGTQMTGGEESRSW